MSEVDLNSFKSVIAFRIYNCNPHLKQLQYFSDAHSVVHIQWPRLAGFSGAPGCGLQCHSGWGGGHPGFSTMRSNILHLLPHETVCIDVHSGPDMKPVVWFKQETIMLTNVSVCKFQKPKQIVLDPFSCTSSIAKAYLVFKKPRRFVRCKVDVWCLKKFMPSLVGVYASQLINYASRWLVLNIWYRQAASVYSELWRAFWSSTSARYTKITLSMK